MSIISKKIYNISLIFKESPLSRLDTELLLAFVLHKNREFILTHPETIITPALYKKFQALKAKRLKDWPIAYLIGSKEFYGLDFKVTPAVLMPRPETEMMVEEIIGQPAASHIIDLGTGSGAIIIAASSEIRRLFPVQFKKIKLSAVDISKSALNIARQNAKAHRLNTKIKFHHGSLLTPLKLETKKIAGESLTIAANLPYLTPTQIKRSPSISREPRLALDGGKDGLKYYRELFKELSILTKKQTIHFRLLCEIDPSQARPINTLAKKILPKAKTVIRQDLAKKNRLAIISQ
jgi:release factor glutamine methyltransferase